MTTPRSTAPATPVLTVTRMLRSPSHESVTTDLSLFSVSSATGSEVVPGARHRLTGGLRPTEHRGSSPNPDNHRHSGRPADIPEVMWFEEGNDLIRSCAALSSALGMQKSFSTSDIAQLPLPESHTNHLRHTYAVSELALNSLQRCGYILDHPRLEHTSRSCSTWVAVGELASTSQLPSPHGGHANTLPSLAANTPPPPAFTAADLIRSVNKKVRQNYIRRRLLTTYRALERLSQSEFNLDRLEAVAAAATVSAGPGPTELIVPPLRQPICPTVTIADDENQTVNQLACPQLKRKIQINLNRNITMYDIERDRGKPLSKYERNMMIFNWLHSLDETAGDDEVPQQ
ncbi:uncharacterized protein LOC132257143 [Phlebotomus argentipes]|uniref:uncharacterized protein LOC132257143 n=1 Tax=Phlebotomus argentipes TaxID=94469 RepID=UPI0028937EF9|nr:uncharacterized protein LOC132257143 [Phlebotomus argentipes]